MWLCLLVSLGLCVGVLTTNKSSHFNILSVFGPYVTTLMQMRLPFYINSDYNVWVSAQYHLKALWKHGSPRGRDSPCVNVCSFTLSVCECVCVSSVCSTLSQGTSAMPPLSQFLTSLLKSMLIQTNFLFLFCSSWDGLEERYNHSSCSSPTVFDFLLPFPPYTLFCNSKSSLPPIDFTRNDDEACQ